MQDLYLQGLNSECLPFCILEVFWDCFLYLKLKLSKGFRTVFVFFPCDSQTRALLCYVQSSGLSASLKCGRVDQGERRRLGVTQDLPIVHFCPDMGWLEARRRPPTEAMTHV